MPWKRKWQPSLVFLPRESHGQRSLVDYGPESCKESDMTEANSCTHTCPIIPAPSLLQPQIYFHSLWVCLFYIFHQNGIALYMAFCMWLFPLSIMFPRFIHVEACVKVVFFSQVTVSLYSVSKVTILSIYQLMDFCIVSTFGLLGIMLL